MVSKASERPRVNVILQSSVLAAAGAVFAAAVAGGAAAAPQAKPQAGKTATVALPAGAGRDVVMRVCSGCHSIALVGARRDTAKGWQRTVDQMINLGATPTSAESDVVIAYLTKNLPRR